MRWCVVLVAAGFIVPHLLADEPKKASLLTPKEIADGWILLFDGETSFGWKIDGDATVKDGTLVIGGKKESIATLNLPTGELYWEYLWPGVDAARLTVAPPPGVPDWSVGIGFSGAGSNRGNTWNATAVTFVRSTGAVMVENSFNSAAPSAVPPPGMTARSTVRAPFFPAVGTLKVPASQKLVLRNVKIKPSGLAPLFNGKDLSGWTQFTANPKQAKSNFSVTKEGWLSVTDGPGDLQTERQFDDFILQLECISNGKHLNSGVFFRCLAGQYQNGYEAQIQNGYRDGDRTKPTDYGTGAVYRRQPARKVLSNDYEWFTMTVIAQGSHIATWVNGYQVTDFTDTRPANDNPRNGSKTGKGAISIQGHDPTTNLSFRNIRIAELSKK
jgi:hypothetical protein